MSFFLPSRLVELKYLGGDEPDKEYKELAKPYQEDIDFAFFVVNFGYTKRDYLELTPRERYFILKAWEDKHVLETSLQYRSTFTATYNVNRPKRKAALKLWNRKKTEKADMEVVQRNMAIAYEVIEKEGNSWIDKIYKANGLKRKEVNKDA